MVALQVVAFLIWIYVLLILSRTNLSFFNFLVGSVGLFFFLMLWIQPLITRPLTMAVTAAAGVLGNWFNMYDAYYEYAMLFIPKDTATVSLYIDYECSGVIEIMAFSCLLWFFPLYNTFEKIAIDCIGIIVIFTANIMRLFIICLLVYCYGNDIFYFAHTIFGRIIFYIFSIILYFYVFTRPHIIRQKVGGFQYGFSDTSKQNR